MVKVLTVPIMTASGGGATGYTQPVSGLVRAIAYVPHASTPLDTDADVVITGNTSGMAILTKTNIGLTAVQWHPRAPLVAVADGSALLYAAGGTAVIDLIPVAEEAIKIVVTNGGDTKSGTFFVYVG